VTSETNRVAYHEAGHVLVGLGLGRQIDSASLALHGGGVTKFVKGAVDATLEQLERGLVMLFADKAAERFAPSFAFPGTWSDDDPWLWPSEELAAEVASDKNPDIRGLPTDEDQVGRIEARVGAEAVERARALAEELVLPECRAGASTMGCRAAVMATPRSGPWCSTTRCWKGARDENSEPEGRRDLCLLRIVWEQRSARRIRTRNKVARRQPHRAAIAAVILAGCGR
jgi:hypothetical protein